MKLKKIKYILGTLLLFLSPMVYGSGKNVLYSVDGAEYEGFFTSPSKNSPLVIILHDWDGLTEYEQKRADMLKTAGYDVFAADLFGKGIRPSTIKDRKERTGELYKNRKKMQALIQGAIIAAKNEGADTDNAVLIGYCFGGAAVLEYARSGERLKGFVAFHGGLSTPEGQDYSKTKDKILVFHGTADDNVTMEDFSVLAQNLNKEGVPHEMITYGGAPHAFTVFNSDRYRKEADHQSWIRFMAFLEETFKTKP